MQLTFYLRKHTVRHISNIMTGFGKCYEGKKCKKKKDEKAQ